MYGFDLGQSWRSALELLSYDVEFLLGQWRGAMVACVLFFAGVLCASVLQLKDDSVLVRLNRAILRGVFRAFGDGSLERIAVVIFLFNSCMMFLYMLSGALVLLPWIFAMLTGLNIALIGSGSIPEWMGERMEKFAEDYPAGAVKACGLAVLLIELPCFWFSIAMGGTLGLGMLSNFSYPHFRFLSRDRVEAYIVVIMPLLAFSAICEALAVKGGARLGGKEYPEDNEQES